MKRLTSADIFGKTFKLHYGRGPSNQHKTALSGLLTLLAILLITPVLIIFSKRVLDKTNPITSTNSIHSSRNTTFQLREGAIFVGFLTFNGSEFPDFEETKKYFTIKAERSTVYEDSSNQTREMRSSFPITSCTTTTQNLTNEIEKIIIAGGSTVASRINAAICGDMNRFYQWYIGGSPTELPYTKIVYRVYPCTLKDRTECIDVKTLGRTQLIFATKYNSMNFSNFLEPVVGGLDSDLTGVFSLNTQAKFTVWFKRNQIYDNSDSRFGNRPKFTFFNIDKISSTTGTRHLTSHCTQIRIEDGLCMPYITFEVRLSNRETVIQRKYYRVFDLVSDVGGMIDLLFIVILAGYVFYRGRKYREWIVSEFDISEKETKDSHDGADMKSSKGLKGQGDRSGGKKTVLGLDEKNSENEKFSSFSWIISQLDVIKLIDYSQKSYILLQVLFHQNYFEVFRTGLHFKLKTSKKNNSITNVLHQKENRDPSLRKKTVKKPLQVNKDEGQIGEKSIYNLPGNNQIATKPQIQQQERREKQKKRLFGKPKSKFFKERPKQAPSSNNFEEEKEGERGPSKLQKFLSDDRKLESKSLLSSGSQQPRFRKKIFRMSKKS